MHINKINDINDIIEIGIIGKKYLLKGAGLNNVIIMKVAIHEKAVEKLNNIKISFLIKNNIPDTKNNNIDNIRKYLLCIVFKLNIKE